MKSLREQITVVENHSNRAGQIADKLDQTAETLEAVIRGLAGYDRPAAAGGGTASYGSGGGGGGVVMVLSPADLSCLSAT